MKTVVISRRSKSNARSPEKIQTENIESETGKKSKTKKKNRSSNVNEVTEPDDNEIIKNKVASASIDDR